MPNMAAEPSPPDQLLKSLDLFRILSPEQQKDLLARSQILEVPRGTYVFRQGERDPYAYFLLRGTLELIADGQLVQEVSGGTAAASHPLAQLQPRQMSAHARTAVSVLRTARKLLDKLPGNFGMESTSDKLQVSEIVEEEQEDWMTRMLQAELFARVPAANIQRIFTCMEPVEVKAGEVVIQQGSSGDYYYIVREGRCQVSRRGSVGGPSIPLAELRPGDSFGEEALVADSRRNASVSMLTDGELMRLTKEDFVELIKRPLLQAVNFEVAVEMVAKGGQWLDVRYPDEHRHGAVPGSLNVALNMLRVQINKLCREQRYVVICDNGARSAVGAFLLIQRGFNAVHLDGGLVRAGVVGGNDIADGQLSLPAEADSAKVLHFPPPIQTGAPIPASHRSEMEIVAELPPDSQSSNGTAQTLEADIRVSALKTELAKANLKIQQALRLRAEAEAARKAAEQQAKKRLRAEQRRLEEAAGKARASDQAFQEKIRAEVEAARKAIEAEAEQRLQVERRRLEEEANKSKASYEEAERLRAELEAARQAAESQAEEKLSAERLRLEEEANKAKASYEEAERLRAELEAARQAAESEAQEKLSAERRRLEEEANKAKASYEEAQHLRAELEAAREAAEAGAERKLAAERERLAEDSRRAEAAIMEAHRLKDELEAAKLYAEEEAQRLRSEEEQKIAQLQAEAEQRLREEREKLEKAYAWKEEELTRVLRLKEEAEQRLQAERDQLHGEAKEARRRLADARKLQQDVERAQLAANAEAEAKLQRQQELEARLREEIKLKVSEERGRLETEFARNAAELEQAQRERDAAERARQAAAQEAERIIAEYKAAHEKWREDERVRLQAERAKLEEDARKIESNLAAARRARDEAETVKRETETHLSQLRARNIDGATGSAAVRRQLRADIAGFEAELQEADRVIQAAARVQYEAEEAREINVTGMERQREQEHELHIELQREIEAWLREQDEFENSEHQREILANQRAHVERIKHRAKAAKDAAKQHDQSLLEELAERLRDWDD